MQWSIEPDIDLERPATPEQKLWRQVLALLVADAAKYHQGLKFWHGQGADAEAAYRDLMTCSDRLKWVSAMAGSDADYVCERFRRWAARHPPGKRFRHKNHLCVGDGRSMGA
jgi:hypothetical protein